MAKVKFSLATYAAYGAKSSELWPMQPFPSAQHGSLAVFVEANEHCAFSDKGALHVGVGVLHVAIHDQQDIVTGGDETERFFHRRG